MKHGYYESKPFTHNNAKRTHTETISLYSGIELAFPFASEIESFYFYHNPYIGNQLLHIRKNRMEHE